MTKILASGISPYDIRSNKVQVGSNAVRLNYMNKNSESIITKYPVVAFDKNGRYSKNPSASIPRMEYSELRTYIPQQKWIPDMANILREKIPVTASIGVQTEDVGTTPMSPVLPSGVPRIPVSSQGVPITTQTEGMYQPNDPSPMIDAGSQTMMAGLLEPMSQVVNNNYYNQVTPVSNFNTTNQQYVNNQVDASTTNQQVVNNTTNQQQIINNTLVQQEMMHLIDNRLQLLTHQNNLQQNLSIITDPTLSQPFRPDPRTFDAGMQITLDQNALMDSEMSIQPAIEYPSNWVSEETRPSMIEEPSTPSQATASFDAPRPVPNRISKKNRRKQQKLIDVTNVKKQFQIKEK